MSAPNLSVDEIRSLNAKIAASPLGSVDICVANAPASGNRLVVGKHTMKGGSQGQLAVGVVNRKGESKTDFANSPSAKLIKCRTPVSTIENAYSFSPARLARWFDPTAAHDVTACLQLAPAGDVAEWNTAMDTIGISLANSFADAMRDHGTCIPGDDKTNKRLAKKRDALKTEAKFREWFVSEMLGADGTPHMSNFKGKILDPAAPYVFRSNLFKGAESMTDTPFDSLLGDKLEDMRAKVGKPCRFSPVPLYRRNKLVTPEEYDGVANRLRGSLVYAVVWCKLFANDKNRVVSLKFGIDKIVIAQLGPEAGAGADAIVDVSLDMAPPSAADVLDVLADVSQEGVGDGPAAKRHKGGTDD